MMPSVQPDMAMAQPTTLAKKKSVPMEPPNSRPSVRLIMTAKPKGEIIKYGYIFAIWVQLLTVYAASFYGAIGGNGADRGNRK